MHGAWERQRRLRRLTPRRADVYKTFRHCRDETDVFNTFTCVGCGVETDLSQTVPFTPPTKKEWLRARGKE